MRTAKKNTSTNIISKQTIIVIKTSADIKSTSDKKLKKANSMLRKTTWLED